MEMRLSAAFFPLQAGGGAVGRDTQQVGPLLGNEEWRTGDRRKERGCPRSGQGAHLSWRTPFHLTPTRLGGRHRRGRGPLIRSEVTLESASLLSAASFARLHVCSVKND